MSGDGIALRLDDVGAASKRYEVYGLTRIPLGPWAVPFPGNFLFLKYLPPIKRWGPYRELTAAEWEAILAILLEAGGKLTVAITAGWVEPDGGVVPYPAKFPEQAAMIRQGLARGLVEVANHGYTHCVLEDRLFRPRLFSGNRQYHREFHDWLPEAVHREHLNRSQEILQSYFGTRVETLVPPGNLLSPKTVAAAPAAGIRYISCLNAIRWGPAAGVTFVDDARVVAFHDRDLVLGGLAVLRRVLDSRRGARFLTVREVGRQQEGAHVAYDTKADVR
jgi:hypothetical protein